MTSPGTTKQIDNNRTAILKLLITCFSEMLFISPAGKCFSLVAHDNVMNSNVHVLYFDHTLLQS